MTLDIVQIRAARREMMDTTLVARASAAHFNGVFFRKAIPVGTYLRFEKKGTIYDHIFRGIGPSGAIRLEVVFGIALKRHKGRLHLQRTPRVTTMDLRAFRLPDSEEWVTL